MRSYGDIIEDGLKRAFGLHQVLQQDFDRIQVSLGREALALEQRLTEISQVAESLTDGVKIIVAELSALGHISDQLLKQYSEVMTAASIAQEDRELSGDLQNAIAAALTMTSQESREIIFADDHKLLGEQLKVVTPETLKKALSYSNEEVREKVREAIEGYKK